MAKRFFFTAMGILALAAAYHVGAATTEAQGSAAFVGVAGRGGGVPGFVALTSAGDVWTFDVDQFAPTYLGSLVGGPAPVESQSFGSVKEMFRR